MSDEQKKRILLVEDEAITGMLEMQQLMKQGYTVHHVTSGEAAVKAIHEDVFQVDLILMDIDLGTGIDGTQAAEKILSSKNIPIVFLSSHTEREVIEKTEKITSYGYVEKKSGIVVLDTGIKMAFKLFEANSRLTKELEERKHMEEKAHEMDNRMRKLFDIIPDLIFQFTRRPDGAYYIPIASKGIRNIFGCSPEEVSEDFEPIRRVIHPEDAIRVMEDIEYSAKNLTYFTCEFRVQIPGRDIQWVLCRSTPELLQDGSVTWFGFSVDITSLKKVEMRLAESEKLMYRAQKIAHIGNWQLDLTVNSLFWSDEVYRIFGCKPQEFAATYEAFVDFIHPDDRAAVNDAYSGSLRDGRDSYEIEHRVVQRDSGDIRYVQERCDHERDATGEIIRSTGMVQDITERKQAEVDIQKQLSQKEILLREVHHRVKNNIANIEDFLSLQADSTDNPEAEKAIKGAISRVQSMRILYEKLLLSKDLREISMKLYIEDLIDSLRCVFIDKKTISIEKEISEFSMISNQAITIGIIINELLTNVFKYAFNDRCGGVVSVSINKSANNVIIIIQDNGVGVDERFLKNKTPGFGLTIVKMLVEQLNGTYSIMNENGTRSVIQFEL